MSNFPVCPLCRGKFIDFTMNSNDEFVIDCGIAVGILKGIHDVNATCENGCITVVRATRSGNPAGSVAVENQALNSGALMGGWK